MLVRLVAVLAIASCSGLFPDARTGGQTGAIVLRTAFEKPPYIVQAVVTPYTRAAVDHVVIRLFRVSGGNEQAVTDSGGNPVARSIVAADLDKTLTLGALKQDTTYRIRGYA